MPGRRRHAAKSTRIQMTADQKSLRTIGFGFGAVTATILTIATVVVMATITNAPDAIAMVQ
jgi:uncharacterized membrane protein required for colicin V production